MKKFIFSITLFLSFVPLIFIGTAIAQNKTTTTSSSEKITFKNEGRTQSHFSLSEASSLTENQNLTFDSHRNITLKDIQQGGSFTTKAIRINLKNPTPFISAYTTWKGENLHDEFLTIAQRTSIDGITWNIWEQTAFDGHVNVENLKEAKRLTSVASFLPKETRFVQYKISWKAGSEQMPSIKDVEVSFYSPGETPKATLKKAKDDMTHYMQSGGCSQPPVVSRSNWGARAPRSSYSYTDVTHLVVHHAYGYDWNDGAAAVRAVQDLHQNSNGWSDIGYNYLIHKSGVIYQGRPENVIGAHFCGYNSRTQGICMLGTFTSQNPTNAAMTSLKKLLAWKASKEGINPLGSSYHYSTGGNVKNIAGHRDGGGCTSCPGNSLYALLPSVRADVNSMIQNDCGGTPPPPPPTGDTTPPTTSISAPTSVTDNFTVTFTDDDNVGVVRRFYQVLESVNAEWRGNKGKGFFNDNFGNVSIHSDYTKGLDDWEGTWWETSEGRLRQSNLNSNTALSTELSQTQGNAYLYNFAAKVNNTSGARRFGMHIMANSQTQSQRGDSYLIWFSTDAGKVYIYETINNTLYTRASATLSTDNSWADYKIAYSTNSGKIEVFKNGQPVLDWTDSSPLTSGSYISLRTNGASVDFDDLKVYKSRGTSQTVFVGTTDWNDVRVTGSPAAKIKSLVKDAAHNWSALGDAEVNITSISTKVATTLDEEEAISSLSLYPNPMADNHLNVVYSLKEASDVDIRLYNVLGEEISILYKGNKQAGNQNQEFELSNLRLKAGTYIIRISTNEEMKTLRLVKI
ncbi:N-acetylmuramoyl-L-alanine amidase [Bernardetia sp.]|uniref:N-acetylmuramoyl-L-alanine amidase n=1 Tax=Bernardetia sp. TaxID=1937974 RepID=UPI0025BB44CC|nr:N-acetylmuramoyl-L-alanine amidase [Bernardetia sp.]